MLLISAGYSTRNHSSQRLFILIAYLFSSNKSLTLSSFDKSGNPLVVGSMPSPIAHRMPPITALLTQNEYAFLESKTLDCCRL